MGHPAPYLQLQSVLLRNPFFFSGSKQDLAAEAIFSSSSLAEGAAVLTTASDNTSPP